MLKLFMTIIIYFKLFLLNPIKINFTFSLAREGFLHSDNPMFIVLESVGLSIAKLENAPVSSILLVIIIIITLFLLFYWLVERFAWMHLCWSILSVHGALLSLVLPSITLCKPLTKFTKSLVLLVSFTFLLYNFILLQLCLFWIHKDMLGNPVGLVNNLGTGVVDFFYEPAQGLVKSPKDFSVGLAKVMIFKYIL